MHIIKGNKHDDKLCDKKTAHNITQNDHHMINDKMRIPDKLILDLISRETNSLLTSYILRASAMVWIYFIKMKGRLNSVRLFEIAIHIITSSWCST